MPKTTDIPVELREFNRIFERITGYKHDYAEAWSDFLDLFIKQFSFDDCEELNQRVQKKYSQEERYDFGALIQETIQIMNKQIRDDKDWYDPFGSFYEAISSNCKRQGFAQFFTPSPIVDLMTEITGEELKGEGLIGDPCCGSGRMIISFHVKHPGNYLVGQDIDSVCCKMTILNMVLHGAKGEVVWGNSLDPSDFRQGWRITPYFTGIPHVYKIDKSESFTWQMWEKRKEEVILKKQEAAKPVQLELNFL